VGNLFLRTEVADMGPAKKMFPPVSMPSGTEKEKPSTPFNPFIRPSFGADPSVRIRAGTKAVIVTAEIPGAEPGDVDISVAGRRLILKRKGNGIGRSEDGGCKGESAGTEKTMDLPYRVNPGEPEVHCDRKSAAVILEREDEKGLYNRTLLEAAIINTISRYFNGRQGETADPGPEENQFLIQALQRYFKGSREE